MKPVLLASYPRSGNTFLRTIMKSCFNLKSASVYPNDLGGNKKLEEDVGHIEHVDGRIPLKAFNDKIPLLKTHELRTTDDRAIYVIRDARPCALSMYNFYRKKVPLEEIVLGRHRWGKWTDHIDSWTNERSKNTLVLKYEVLVENLDISLSSIAEFLGAEAIDNKAPPRGSVSDGRWINKQSKSWQDVMTKQQIELCTHVNRKCLEKYGYL